MSQKSTVSLLAHLERSQLKPGPWTTGPAADSLSRIGWSAVTVNTYRDSPDWWNGNHHPTDVEDDTLVGTTDRSGPCTSGNGLGWSVVDTWSLLYASRPVRSVWRGDVASSHSSSHDRRVIGPARRWLGN